MGHSFLPSNTKIFRAAKNVHRFFYFLNNRIYTFVTFEKGFSTQVAALFGALNALTAGAFLLSGAAQALDSNALPTGYQSVSGNVTFDQTQPNVLNVSTQANSSVASYDTFNVGSNATVNFALPSSSSRILNKVNAGGGLSEIHGHINSNGQVFLVNSAGVFFANGSTVNVGGLVASTLNIADNDFLGGNLHFNRDAGSAQGKITVANGATINANESASFIASSFENAGNITVPHGAVQVAVGDKVTLASDLVGFTIDEGVKDALDSAAIDNSGTMTAESIKLASKTIHDATKASIVNTGTVKATNAITGAGGVIELVSDGGITRQAGTLDATGSTGGQINVLGDYVSISNGSLTNASGTNGGGNINIGGGFQGNDPSLLNAQQTAVGDTAQIKADAIESGNGGDVVIWSDKYTRYYGDISAKGGATSGNGGNIEVSGKEYLDFQGSVNTTATNGRVGTLLLDPLDLTVVDAGGTLAALTDADDFADTPAVSSSIDVGLINAAGANVTLRANQDLTFNNTTTALTLGAFALTAEAGRDITVNAGGNISANNGITFTAGRDISTSGNLTTTTGNITLTAGQALPSTPPAAGGTGTITVGATSLYTTGTGDVILSAPDTVALNGDITTSGGNLSATSTNATISIGGGSSLQTGSGSATFNASTGISSLAGAAINATGITMTSNTGGLTLAGNATSAGTIGFTATTSGAISANAGGVISGTTLTATANDDITISGTDVNAAFLTASGDNITFFDRDGATVVANAGSPTTGSVLILTGTGVGGDNGVLEAGLVLGAGTTQGQSVTLDANAGNISQAVGSVLQGTDLTASATIGNITLDDADFDMADLLTTGADITYKDFDGVSIVADTGSVSVGIVDIETSAAGVTADNTLAETDLELASGMTQAGTVNLTANAGNISQLVGSAVQGLGLNASAASGTITLDNADFSTVGLTTFVGANIVYKDSDGVEVVADTGSTTVGTANIETSAVGLTADNGAVETGLFLASGATQAGTVNLLANVGDIGQVVGSVLQADAVDATTVALGATQTFADMDTNTGVFTSNQGDITVSDTDGLTVTATTGMVGAGNVAITAFDGLATATNSNVEADLLLTGNNLASQYMLTTNSGNIDEIGTTLQGVDLVATNNALFGTIDIHDADYTNVTLSTVEGNITYKDFDGANVTADADSSVLATVDIETNAAGLMSDNSIVETGLNINGFTQGGTVNLRANTDNITQDGGADVHSTNLSVRTAAGNATLTNVGNTLDTLSATTNSGIVSITDAAGGFNIVSANLDNDAAGDKGDLLLTALGGGSITQTVNIIADEVRVVLGGGGDATLNRNANQLNIVSALADTSTSSVLFNDSNGYSVADTDLAGGNLTLRSAGNIDQPLILSDNDISTGGDITGVNQLYVRMRSGADATLRATGNDITHLRADSAAAGSVIDVFDSTGFNVRAIALTGDSTLSIESTTGNFTQSNAAHSIVAGHLNVQTSTGNSTFNNAGNDVAVYDVVSASGTHAFTDGKDGFIATGNVNSGSLTLNAPFAGGSTNGDPYGAESNLEIGNLSGASIALTAGAGGNITQSAGSTFAGGGLAVTADGNVTLGTGANLDFAQYTLNSAGMGNTFDVTDTDNFEVLGVTAPDTNVLLTASGSGMATDFNLNPLAPAVPEVDMQVTGVITANNLTLTGNTGSILLDNDITTTQALVVNTKDVNGDITQAAAKTLLVGTTSSLKTEGATGADITINGNVNATDANTVETTGAGASGDGNTITVAAGAGVTSTNGTITLSTVGEDSTIDIDATIESTNANVLVSTTGRTSDITLQDNSNLQGATDVSVTTTGLGSDITLESDGMGANAIVNSGGTATLSTTNRYADIATAEGTTVTGVDAVTVSTADRRSDIAIAGSVTSTAGTVDVTTTGDIGTITIDSTGSILANTNAVVSTTGVDATIDIDGDVMGATGTVLVSTAGDTSDIVIQDEGQLKAATDVSISTIGLGSDITLDSDGMGGGAIVSGFTTTLSTTNRYADIFTGVDTSVGAKSAVIISTADRRSDIQIAGSVTSGTSTVAVTTTGDIGTITIDSTGSLLAETDATVSTTGDDASINVDGSITATSGNVLVSTAGMTSTIELNTDSVIDAGDTATIQTSGLNGLINTHFDSTLTAVNAVTVTSTGPGGNIDLNGTITSTASTVDVTTAGLDATIHTASGGLINADGNINIETTGVNGDITLDGDMAATNNGIVTITTADVTSDIIQGSDSFIGDFFGNTKEIQYLANGSGNITLGGENAAIDRMSAEIAGSDGLLTVQSTGRLDSLFHVDLKSDHMAFEAGNEMNAGLVQFAAQNATTTIGVAGGAGTLQLTQEAFDGIGTIFGSEVRIGDAFTDSLITLGQLDLRALPVDITFNTLNSVQDATPTDDSGAAKNNLLMATNQNVVFTGGAADFADPLTATGITHVGNEVSIFGDIDIDLPGTSLAFVKLPDGLFSGKTIRAITAMGDAFVNITEINNQLKNLAGALGGQSKFSITNEATKEQMLLLNGPPPAEVDDQTDAAE